MYGSGSSEGIWFISITLSMRSVLYIINVKVIYIASYESLKYTYWRRQPVIFERKNKLSINRYTGASYNGEGTPYFHDSRGKGSSTRSGPSHKGIMHLSLKIYSYTCAWFRQIKFTVMMTMQSSIETWIFYDLWDSWFLC